MLRQCLLEDEVKDSVGASLGREKLRNLSSKRYVDNFGYVGKVLNYKRYISPCEIRGLKHYVVTIH